MSLVHLTAAVREHLLYAQANAEAARDRLILDEVMRVAVGANLQPLIGLLQTMQTIADEIAAGVPTSREMPSIADIEAVFESKS